MKSRTLAVSLLLAATILAGCSGSSGNGTFTATAPDAPGGAWTFKALAKGDNYTWDLGDRLTTLYGKEVSHTYDFNHGSVDVRLTVTDGDAQREFLETIEVGPGTNTPPALFLDVSTNWAVTGEPVRISGDASTDSENDPLRFAFSCIRTGEIVLQAPGHVHVAPKPSVPIAGQVLPRVALAPISAPDVIHAGNLCDAIADGKPSLADTIEGSFAQSGVYDVYMFAGDPLTDPAVGRMVIYVTEPAMRPATVQSLSFAGNLTVGQGGAAQDAIDGNPVPLPAEQPVLLDKDTHIFSVPLDNQVTYVNLTYDPGAAGANQVSWTLYQEDRTVATGGGAGSSKALLAADSLKRGGTYRMEVILAQGGGVAYTLDIDNVLNLDPTRLF